MITVDLKSRHISPSTNIFVARPGSNYRFFEIFQEAGFVGPDLPNLDLPRFDDLDEIDDLPARVARSAAIRRYHMGGRRDDLRPERNLEPYLNRRFGRSNAQLTRVVRAYFKTMRKGDLVIVPPGSFRGLAQIGELATAPTEILTQPVDRYETDLLQGRRVRWLASIPKADLPAATLDALQKPSPLFAFPRNGRADILRRAYGSYYEDDDFSVRFEVTSEDFRVTNDLYIQGFFNFVATNYYNVRDKKEGVTGFYEAAFQDLGDKAPQLYTNVNSPGGLSLKSALAIPMVIAAMFAVAVMVGPAAHALAQQGAIEVVNTLATADDACVIEVHEQVITQMQLLGYDEWVEACRIARSAAEATGLESGVDVTN